MDRSLLPPVAGWMLVIVAAGASLAGSFGYLGSTMHALVARAEQPAAARSAPDFVTNVEPLPTGSISAIEPLPASRTSSAMPAEPSLAPAPPSTSPEMVANAVPPEVPVAAPSVPDNASRMVATIAVNVRDRPSNDSRVVGTLREGAVVAVVASRQGWLQVSDGSRTGWVYGRYLRPNG
jgi:uncharacterized protein YgiM (DUF1202 family)